VAHALSHHGYEVIGVDASPSGIAQAKRAFPELSLHVGSAYDPLAARYGTFQAVLSLEVIEHLYAPRDFVRGAFDLLEPGGTLLVSTPYHGYLKNLALAVCGAMDRHFTALWDGGHIKFFSMRTLSALLNEVGFVNINYARVGRVPPLAKSMVATAQKPPATTLRC
jgi:2-polyprenyl-6-hydroxyphenyl methylase/3-demethylubiquinone-9 3-methyltransferase